MSRSLLPLALALAAAALPARAEITQCTPIHSLPAVINAQGVYCLRQDLSTAMISGAAVAINTNNVTLDCNDRKIGGLGGGAGTVASGIYAFNRKNVTIRNCGLRGFRIGIWLDGGESAYHLVEGNRLDLNRYRGMLIHGDGSTVRGNRVYDSGNGPEHIVYGITAIGAVTVIDNTVQGVAGPVAVGLFVNATASDGSAFVAQNRVAGIVPTQEMTGIHARGRVAMAGNMVATERPPSASHVGIHCDGDPTLGILRDTILVGFASPAWPVFGCEASGGP